MRYASGRNDKCIRVMLMVLHFRLNLGLHFLTVKVRELRTTYHHAQIRFTL